MIEMTEYWAAWSPYWSYEEDFFLSLEVINKLKPFIAEPVLIIGAGQGLIVEELCKKGFKVDGIDFDANMVMYAKKRRGINLIQADAKNMPFTDRSYKTSIIATGVVDFLSDEEEIKLIINEALRVTDDSGKVFVAFYKYHPEAEKPLRYMGLITDTGIHRIRRMNEMIKLSCESPIGFIRFIKREANVGFLRAFVVLMKSQLFLPKKEKRASRRISKMWKQIKNDLDNPEMLIECTPESVPYRSGEQIRNMFKNLNISTHNTLVYDNCTIVQL